MGIITIIVKPVLVESKERTDLAIVTKQYVEYAVDPDDIDVLHKISRLEKVVGEFVHLDFYKCQQLIFTITDPNDKIEVGDIGYINIGGGTIGTISYDNVYNTWDLTTKDGIHYPFSAKVYIKKVIVPQNKIPESYIQRFIDEYNNGEVGDVEIEMEEGLNGDIRGKMNFFKRPKLTDGFITIIENETNLDIELKAYCISKTTWIESQEIAELHDKIMSTESFFYTEDEVRRLCSKAALIHFNKEDLLWQFDNWFELNKKK